MSQNAFKHGMHGTHVYDVWKSMRQRCYNPRNKSYENYGGRGIRVCKRWELFEKFLADMGPPRGLTLDRRNNDGNYTPKNCRWATRMEQSRNKRPYPKHSAPRRLIRFQGRTKGLCEWARTLGIPYRTILWRLAHGWPMSKALGRKINV